MSIARERAGPPQRRQQPTFAELYSPKLLTVLREGYGLADFRADLISGLTVAIVALPLSMAIAIASGVTPDRGLYAAVVGGFLVGIFENLAGTYIPYAGNELKLPIALALIVSILVVKPAGLFGRHIVKRV
jgi:hypothetical protein